jgi:pyridoxal phosphate enzyme (YggS family)
VTGSGVSSGSVASRLKDVQATIARAADRAGRDPASVRIVAVTKGVSLEPIRQALELGLRTLGENRVQEALPKIQALSAQAPDWHLVGHLQTNKARQAVESFSMIESVDSVRLVEALSARARRRLEVLIEVNLTGEASKTGAPPDEVEAIVRAIGGSRNLRLQGLMAIGPLKGGPEAARPVFRRLRSMRDDLRQRFSLELPELSMGMSEDYPVGVEEGASMLRLGRALFASSLIRAQASPASGVPPLK